MPFSKGANPTSVIKPRTTKIQFVRHITRLYRENNETLFAYAAFIGEHTEYVQDQLVETILARDKAFLEWREKHPGSQVRTSTAAARRVRPKSAPGSLPCHPAPTVSDSYVVAPRREDTSVLAWVKTPRASLAADAVLTHAPRARESRLLIGATRRRVSGSGGTFRAGQKQPS
jgi:hypothetical protein